MSSRKKQAMIATTPKARDERATVLDCALDPVHMLGHLQLT